MTSECGRPIVSSQRLTPASTICARPKPLFWSQRRTLSRSDARETHFRGTHVSAHEFTRANQPSCCARCAEVAFGLHLLWLRISVYHRSATCPPLLQLI